MTKGVLAASPRMEDRGEGVGEPPCRKSRRHVESDGASVEGNAGGATTQLTEVATYLQSTLNANTLAGAEAATSAPEGKGKSITQALKEEFRASQRRRTHQSKSVESSAVAADGSTRSGTYNPAAAFPLHQSANDSAVGHESQTPATGAKFIGPFLKPCVLRATERVCGESRESSPVGEAAVRVTASSLRSRSLESGQFLFPNSATRTLQGTRMFSFANTSLGDMKSELMANLTQLFKNVGQRCSPLPFDDLHRSLRILLAVVERGDLSEVVEVPFPSGKVTLERPQSSDGCGDNEVTQEGPCPSPTSGEAVQVPSRHKAGGRASTRIVGAEAAMDFVCERVFEVAYRVTPALHTAEWVIDYTMSFVRRQEWNTEADIAARDEILAWCIRHIATINVFHATLLALESKSEEYDAFMELREETEARLTQILDEVSNALRKVLAFRFPYRRQKLTSIELLVKVNIHRVLAFLSDLDANWTPTVQYHAEWKHKVLSDTFRLIHGDISQSFLLASLGFIDKALYKDVTGVTARGATRKVPMVQHLAEARAVKKHSFSEIAVELRGVKSKFVGMQLCMGARYVLRETDAEFDSKWGFPMNLVAPDLLAGAQNQLSPMDTEGEGVALFDANGAIAPCMAHPSAEHVAMTASNGTDELDCS